MSMNEDLKEFPVYGLSKQGLIPINIQSVDDYNHYTHNLHHFIKQQNWKKNRQWFKDRGIEQKLILLPFWLHQEVHNPTISESEFKSKFNINRYELIFNRKYSKY